MTTHSQDSNAARSVGRNDRLGAEIAELMAELLTDVATDVEVVVRELNLRDAMRERLRRALDRLDCAQAVSRSMGATAAGIGDEDAVPEAAHAVQMLAAEWPDDYPDGMAESMFSVTTSAPKWRNTQKSPPSKSVREWQKTKKNLGKIGGEKRGPITLLTSGNESVYRLIWRGFASNFTPHLGRF